MLGAGDRSRLAKVFQESEALGLSVYAVGGCVRDELLGRATRDLDLVVDGDAAVLARRLAGAVQGRFEEFGRFGTVRCLWPDGGRLDLAGSRTEAYSHPGSLPTVATAPFGEDLKRRDFTVNAMARRLLSNGRFGDLIDPFGGAGDLGKGKIRVLHERSFQDDPTRLLRAARYAGRLGFSFEKKTGFLARRDREGLRGISRERLRQELWRLLEERDPGPAFKRISAWGLGFAFHEKFRWPKTANAARQPALRLGLCAASLGTSQGSKFISSFPFPRDLSRPILEVLGILEGGRAPAAILDPAAAKLLMALAPSKAAAAPRFLTGDDLRAAGLKPGPSYARILNEAAKEQWSGRISSKRGALSWLKERLVSGDG